MAKFFNRAKMTTATTGTGTITLGSAAVGFQTFANAGASNGDVVQYVIEEGTNFEIGTGTYTASGTTLSRGATESSNSGNEINLGGNAFVSITAVDDDYNRLEHQGSTKVTATATGATVTGTVTATSFTGDGSALTGIVSIPSGVIAIWSGSTGAIPSGWVLCNGSNSTPDLRNRFVVGAGDSYSVDATGGANTVTLATTNLPSHSHSFSANTGNGGDHSHNFNTNTGNSGNHTHSGSTGNVGNHTHSGGGVGGQIRGSFNTSTFKGYGASNANTGGAGSHSHNIGTNGGGDHSHNFNANTGNSGNHTHSVSGNTGNAGSGNAITITPPYYALAYIMKT